MNDIPKTDQQIRVELARETKDLMENRAYAAAVTLLERQLVGEIENDATEAPKVQELVAKLRALRSITMMLNSLMAASHPVQRGAHVGQFGRGGA